MYYQPAILSEEIITKLKRFNEADCVSAIKILRRRLKDLRDPAYYLTISVDDLQFSTRAFDALKANKLETVRDILEFGWHKMELLRNTGPKTVKEIKNKMDAILANKNRIRGVSGLQLALAIADEQNK